jgi:hypothetical protein
MSDTTEQQAWLEGLDAAMADYDETDNPYPIESDEYLSWNDGWAAFWDEQ